MGWSLGYDDNWQRDIGYGVPATCDHPGCGRRIDRGLAYVCGGDIRGGEDGCGLYCCGDHLWMTDGKPQRCERCINGKPPFEPTPDTAEWAAHKLMNPTWAVWRTENEDQLPALRSLATPSRSRTNEDG